MRSGIRTSVTLGMASAHGKASVTNLRHNENSWLSRCRYRPEYGDWQQAKVVSDVSASHVG